MKKGIIIRSQFGHEIMALNFAKTFGLPAIILPKAENKDEFNLKSKDIFENLSFFYDNLKIIAFEERERFETEAWDIVSDVKSGTLDNRLWEEFAKTTLSKSQELTTKYPGLNGRKSILFIPQKLFSDGECGITAQQQSLPLELFDFLKNVEENLILGQHFHKENDRELVKNLAREFNLYVPGADENQHVFGIRGIRHKEYYDMYCSLSGSVGIAGTHTWIMLTMFPKVPQIILFNKNGVEDWECIGKAFRAQKYPIHCIGFDEKTDMQELSKTIMQKYKQLFG